MTTNRYSNGPLSPKYTGSLNFVKYNNIVQTVEPKREFENITHSLRISLYLTRFSN